MLEELHCGGLLGHFDHDRTFVVLEMRVWWPKMMADVRRFIRGCEVC